MTEDRKVITARAPGRLDLMGGIADYSGSLVLQWPIASSVFVNIQRQSTKTLRVVSVEEQTGQSRLFEMNLADLLACDYSTLREHFNSQPENHWAAHIVGAFSVLKSEKNISFDEGARFFITSQVPEGKGVGSSAALEVAAMQAVVAAYEINVSAEEVGLLCHKVENLVVGAPSGVMDQMTAACGEENRLLELLCQPAELKGTICLPEELEVLGIDSGIRHSVGGADYRTVRTAAFMGYRMIAELAGLSSRQTDLGHVAVDDKRWNGYLVNIAPEEFDREYAPHIPENISGSEFLNKYEGITDTVTSVDPHIDYPVLASTRHPIYEHARVNRFAAILKNWKGGEQREELGELMYGSHESYSSCGLGSDGTDAIVSLVREFADEGLYGAKITGGGSGGTVAVLGRRESGDAIRKVCTRYCQQTGYEPQIIHGSSSGAVIVA